MYESCNCDHPDDTCASCRPDKALAASMEEAIDATRVADHTPGIGRLIAGKVAKPATLSLRSAAASRIELNTDIVAAEDAVDPARSSPIPAPIQFRNGRPEARQGQGRDAGDHAVASLPEPGAYSTVRMVTMTIDVPILVGYETTKVGTVTNAVHRVRQQIPDVVISFDEAMCVDNETVEPSAMLRDREEAIGRRIFRHVEDANTEAARVTSARDEDDAREDFETREDSHRFYKGGA